MDSNENEKEKEVGTKKASTLAFSRLDYEYTLGDEGLASYSREEYVRWGIDNEYPRYLYNLYLKSTSLSSIINACVKYTVGDGIINSTNLDNSYNGDDDSVEDVVSKLIFDLWLYGGFTVMLHYNSLGQVTHISYVDIARCRLTRDKKHVFVKPLNTHSSRKWLCMPTYNPDEAGNEGHEVQIAFYAGNRAKGFYPMPDYHAGIIWAEIQAEIGVFHYAQIGSSFNVDTIITIPEPLEDESKDELEYAVNTKFGGARGHSILIINGREINVSRLPASGFEQKYNALYQSTVDSLQAAFQMPPVLSGITVQTGFNTQEFLEAFALFNKTCAEPKQNEINRFFKGIKGIEGEITCKTWTLTKEEANDTEEVVAGDTLAELIGVTGVSSLITLMASTEIPETQKQGLLKVLFGLSDMQVSEIFVTSITQ